jgi:pyridoxamine 5'-phosphate oxidase
MNPNPIAQFQEWFDQAKSHPKIRFAEAMCLSTIDPDGFPDGRIVLLRGLDERGFIFYTNFHSAKGRALKANPNAALTFHWAPLDFQVRIQGSAEIVSDKEADAYFSARPRESQIGAWASDQSEPLDSRETLISRFKKFEKEFAHSEVPRPAHWSGFRVVPRKIEFWINGEYRLHDRFLYVKSKDGKWQLSRLYP